MARSAIPILPFDLRPSRVRFVRCAGFGSCGPYITRMQPGDVGSAPEKHSLNPVLTLFPYRMDWLGFDCFRSRSPLLTGLSVDVPMPIAGSDVSVGYCRGQLPYRAKADREQLVVQMRSMAYTRPCHVYPLPVSPQTASQYHLWARASIQCILRQEHHDRLLNTVTNCPRYRYSYAAVSGSI